MWSRSSATTAPACSGFGWPWWLAVPFAMLVARSCSALIGLLAVRTAGIYTIMITLAIATAFFYFAQQNYSLFNGHCRLSPASRRRRCSASTGATPVPFYYLCLAMRGACYLAVLYISRAAFGLALQAIRDNPRRMRALGFNVTAAPGRRLFLAGLIAGAGRRAASLVQRPHLARHDQRRPADRRPGHRRGRRPAPSDRARSSALSSSCCSRPSPSTWSDAERFNTLIGAGVSGRSSSSRRTACWACGQQLEPQLAPEPLAPGGRRRGQR